MKLLVFLECNFSLKSLKISFLELTSDNALFAKLNSNKGTIALGSTKSLLTKVIISLV